MAIPDYASCMLPLLEAIADAKPHAVSEVRDALAKRFGLTRDEREQQLPSGRQAIFDNRVGWAKTYLAKAGLVAAPKRGLYLITERGVAVLAKKPAKIDPAFLSQFESFQSFYEAEPEDAGDAAPAGNVPPSTSTPEEEMQRAHVAVRTRLAQDLLDAVSKASPVFFEQLVVELLVKMGYGGTREDAGRALGKSHDGGLDGIIKEDHLGLDAIYIQAKRWQNNVGRPEIQAFAGSLEGERARKGVFITTSTFTAEARDYVKKIEKKIVLMDGRQLAGLMIDFGVGVTTIATYDLKRVDGDYFVED